MKVVSPCFEGTMKGAGLAWSEPVSFLGTTSIDALVAGAPLVRLTLSADPACSKVCLARVGTTADGDHLAEVAAEIQRQLGDRVVLQAWPAVVAADSPPRTIHLLEAFDRDVDKWNMLQRHAAGRGIDGSEIAAIGDGLNDIGMVGGAGLGIAMAGADERVRTIADRETGPPGSGVGEAIRRILD